MVPALYPRHLTNRQEERIAEAVSAAASTAYKHPSGPTAGVTPTASTVNSCTGPSTPLRTSPERGGNGNGRNGRTDRSRNTSSRWVCGVRVSIENV